MQYLVDADIIVYRAAWATQYPQYLLYHDDDTCEVFQYKKDADYAKESATAAGQNSWISKSEVTEPEKNALHIIDSIVGGIAAHFKVQTDSLSLCLSGEDNFRKEVAVTKPYKGKRKAKPTHYDACRDYLTTKYRAHLTNGEEADDWLGYMQYPLELTDPTTSVIVTIDKDLDMIPGLHYNFVKDIEYYVDEDEADRFFMLQLLMGDNTDNIQGIEGCGPKTAEAHLEDVPTDACLSKIRSIYMDAYGDEADTVLDEMADLLWIRRAPFQKYSYHFGEIETWQQYS